MKDDLEEELEDRDSALGFAVEIVASYVANNTIASDQLPALIRSVHAALATLSDRAPAPASERPKPAVPINKSIHRDFLVCLEDGKELKMLKRHLRSTYGMTPDQYRKRWGLPADYPMVAPSYAARRSDFAKRIGLGKGVRKKAPKT